MTRIKQTAHKSTRESSCPKNLAAKARHDAKTPAGKEPAQTKSHKSHHYKPGTVALHEIHCYQKSTELLILKLLFQCVVREIAHDFKKDICFEKSTLLVLQKAVESYMINNFEMINLCAIHAQRVTIQKKNMRLVRRLHEMMIGFEII
ncbi:hypothetical protein ACJ72_07543 [Emergomyces africanus]|uniref:Histone H3 n=1 Tax=Emergomyces africanus TaxID=1955775 RepID=A0A1B7NMW4_9EURO|nr:hypothetical protein ACJ72_07543 [Emergomyces africanus]